MGREEEEFHSLACIEKATRHALFAGPSVKEAAEEIIEQIEESRGERE